MLKVATTGTAAGCASTRIKDRSFGPAELLALPPVDQRPTGWQRLVGAERLKPCGGDGDLAAAFDETGGAQRGQGQAAAVHSSGS